MDWIFEALPKLVPVIIAIVYFLATKNREEKEDEVDPEAAARARKIQEEIRRRILERQGGGTVQAEEPTIVFEDSPEEWEEEVVQTAPPPLTVSEERLPEPAPYREDPSDAYERRRLEIAKELEKASEMRRQAFGNEQSQAMSIKKPTTGYIETGGSLRQQLSNTGSVRRAFVLKEILDTPVGLR